MGIDGQGHIDKSSVLKTALYSIMLTEQRLMSGLVYKSIDTGRAQVDSRLPM